MISFHPIYPNPTLTTPNRNLLHINLVSRGKVISARMRLKRDPSGHPKVCLKKTFLKLKKTDSKTKLMAFKNKCGKVMFNVGKISFIQSSAKSKGLLVKQGTPSKSTIWC